MTTRVLVVYSVEIGLVSVTVVGVAAHTVQTVTVVVQPSGIVAVVVAWAGPEGGLVAVAVAVAGLFPGQ
jgi:hypothetical protein